MKSFLRKHIGFLMIVFGFLCATITTIEDQRQHHGIHRLIVPMIVFPLILLAYERMITFVYQQTTTDRELKPYPTRLILILALLLEAEYVVIAVLLYLTGMRW